MEIAQDAIWGVSELVAEQNFIRVGGSDFLPKYEARGIIWKFVVYFGNMQQRISILGIELAFKTYNEFLAIVTKNGHITIPDRVY